MLIETNASSNDFHDNINNRLSMSELCQFSIHQTGIWSKLHQNRALKSESKLLWKKYIEMTSIFHPSKLRRIRYIKITSIFGSSILHQKSISKRRRYFANQNYVEQVRRNNFCFLLCGKSTSKRRDFSPSKLHRRNTLKQLGNTTIFSFRRIDVISTSNGCWLHVLRWLDLLKFLYV